MTLAKVPSSTSKFSITVPSVSISMEIMLYSFQRGRVLGGRFRLAFSVTPARNDIVRLVDD